MLDDNSNETHEVANAFKEAQAMVEFQKIAKRTGNNKLSIAMKDINLTTLAAAVTGKPRFPDQMNLMKQDELFIKEVEKKFKFKDDPEREHVYRHLQLNSPSGQPVAFIDSPVKHPKPRIQSNVAGRLELEHIKE